MARRKNPFLVVQEGRKFFVYDEDAQGNVVAKHGPYRSRASAYANMTKQMAKRPRKKVRPVPEPAPVMPDYPKLKRKRKDKKRPAGRMIAGKRRVGKTWVTRKTRAKPQKKFKRKPKRPEAFRALAKLGKGGKVYHGRKLLYDLDKDLQRFIDTPKVEIVRKGKFSEVIDEEGRTILRAKHYRGLKRDLTALKEAYLGRPSKATVKRMKLKTVKGFKLESVDPFYGQITQSRRLFSGSVPIGEARGGARHWNERAGRMVDPKKYLGAFFEQLSPQNWGEMLRAALPAYARRKGVAAEVGLRITYKTKTGVKGTVVKFMTMDQSTEIRSWIGLCRDILSEIGRKHGYAGKNKVLSLDLLTVLPT